MRRITFPLALAVTASFSLAQSCPDRTFGSALGTGDDTVFGIQPIGFSFPFAGTNYQDVHVCTNGYVCLSNAGVPAPGAADFSATTAEFVAGAPRIAPLWTDFNVLPAAGGQVYINSTATKCTITWDNVIGYAGLGVVAGPKQQIQLQLFPNGEIRCFYSANATNQSTAVGGSAAIAGATPGGGATLPAAVDLSAGGATPDNTVFETWATAQTFDLGARSLTLVPSSPGFVFAPSLLTGCGEATNYGSGCIRSDDSFYEFFGAAAAYDLNGRTITMLRNGGGYTVLDSIAGTYVTPGAAAVAVAAGDDAVQTVALSAAMPTAAGTTTSLTICSNGHVALAAVGNGNAWTPVAATFLGWANTVIANWHDYNQTIAGSGLVKFEEVAGVAYVTWENVYSHTTTQGDRWQMQFEVATGNVTIVFDAMAPGGNAYLVGYSVGGASGDPGSMDLSTALATPLIVSDTLSLPLTLTANGVPYLGNAGFALDTTNVPNLAPVGILFFGDSQLPGVDLGSIGAPNCRGYTNANLTSLTFPVTLPAGTGSLPLPIPTTAALVGLTLTCQSAAFSLATSLGLVTSNGTSFTLGL